MEHFRALRAAINNPLLGLGKADRKPAAHTWIRTVEADLKPFNIGLHSAWHRAQDQKRGGVLFTQLCPTLWTALDDDDDDDDDGGI